MDKIINIIIPAYNEGENIIKVLEQIVNNVKYEFKIYIIYDNDNDTTIKPVEFFLVNHKSKIFLVKNIYGRGALNALKTGYSVVSEGVTIQINADLCDEIELINGMFNAILEGYDVVCGSRYMKGGHQIGGIWYKKILSRLAGVSLHYFIKIPTHDISNSFKMYRTEIIKNIEIESSAGFEVIVELIVKAYLKGYKITELPTTWQDIPQGDSQFKLFKWLKYYIHWYVFAIQNYFKRDDK